jgi:aerobic carbon-monoxide dehydrogenase medium subunit
VKPAPFDYAAPRSLDEAVAELGRHGDDAKVLAGGQSLVPMLNFRLARPRVVLDINRVTGLDTLVDSRGTLRVGALVRQRRLERWAAGRSALLAAALGHIGHSAIRNRGTVTGSVVHADPAAELPALLLALDGVVVARSARGEREIAAADLFQGPLTTSLGPDEIATETRWTLPPATEGWGFHEVARRHGDFALVGAIAVVGVRGGRVEHARAALFGAGPTPVRLAALERALVGQAPAAATLRAAAESATRALDTAADLHATAEYRRAVAATLVTRALVDAAGRAKDLAG